MTKRLSKLIKTIVFCEEVRQEANGKHIVIGAVGGDLKVMGFPGRVPIALYLEIELPEIGHHSFDFRLTYAGEESLQLSLQIDKHDSPNPIASIFTPRLDLLTKQPGDLVVEMSGGDGEWTEILRRSFQLGDSPPMPQMG